MAAKKISLNKHSAPLPPETISELEQLSALLKAIRGNCIVFALYRTVADREFIVKEINERSAIPIKEHFLSEIKKDVIGLLGNLGSIAENRKLVLFLYDLERTFPESLGNLNLQREALAEIPYTIVFWVREFGLQQIAQKAPDFWAWRSEVFDFRLPQTDLSKPMVQGIVSEPEFFHKTKEDLERRISLFRELLNQQKHVEQPDKTTLAYLANQIGLMYTNLSEFEIALGYYEQSLKIRRELGDKSGECTTLNNIGGIYHTSSDYDTALGYLQQSLKISREIGDKGSEGSTLNNISQIYHARSDYDSALEYLHKSLKISREICDKHVEGTTLNNIGQLYDARGDYERALEYLHKSLKIRREIGDKSGEGATLNNISQIYDARGDYERALDYLQQSLKICRQIGDKNGEGTTLNNISLIYHARGDYERALDYLQQSLKISREIGNKRGEGVTCYNMAKIYENQGDVEKAIELVQRRIEIDRSTGSPDLDRDLAYLNKLKDKSCG